MEPMVKDFGAAPYLLYLILIGCGTGLWWFATQILIPVRDDHREFLKKLDRNLETISDQVQTLPCRTSTSGIRAHVPPPAPVPPSSTVRQVSPT